MRLSLDCDGSLGIWCFFGDDGEDGEKPEDLIDYACHDGIFNVLILDCASGIKRR